MKVTGFEHDLNIEIWFKIQIFLLIFDFLNSKFHFCNFLSRETNLKSRQCEEPTNQLGEDEQALSKFNGHIVCEPPNNNLSRFEGTLVWEGKKYALDNDNIVLRGAILRNTPWCYGVVVFAGKDTKLMQNSGKTKFKRTSIDRLLNFIILGVR